MANLKHRRRFGGLPEEEVMAEINITPLTDVLLVLLIIFLIAAAAGIFGFNIKLPQGNPQHLTKSQFKGVMVTIPFWAKQKNVVFVGAQLVNLDILPNYLYQEHLKKNTNQVVMQVDQQAPYGVVIKVMDSSESAGLDNISFAAPLVPR